MSGLLGSTLAAGCGKVSGSDAADASTDAVAGDGDPGGDATVVTQTALFGGLVGGKAGSIDVVSSLPDGSMLAAAKTDADGRATIRVYPGGSLTAIYKHTIDLGADLITWVGVMPGETLTFGSRDVSLVGQPNTALGSETYLWQEVPTNAAHYKVWTSCNLFNADPPTTSVTGTEASGCHHDPMATLWTYYDSNNALNGWGEHYDVFKDGGTISMHSSTVPRTATITLTGLPAEVSSVSGTFRSVLGPLSDYTVSSTYGGPIPNGSFTTTLPVADVMQGSIGVVDLARSEADFHAIHVLDFIPRAFPVIQNLASPALPPWARTPTTTSVASRTASWTVVASAASVHTGQLLHMNWSHIVAGTPNPSQWDVILPSGQTSFAFPTLPSQLSDSEPTGSDALSGVTRVFAIPSVTGYEQLRTLPSANIMCLECAVRTKDFQRVLYTEM